MCFSAALGWTSITNGSMCRAVLPAASEKKSSTPASLDVSSDFTRETRSASSRRVTTGPTAVSSSSSVPRRMPRARVILMSGASDGASSPASSCSMRARSQPARSASSSADRPSDSRTATIFSAIRLFSAMALILPPGPTARGARYEHDSGNTLVRGARGRQRSGRGPRGKRRGARGTYSATGTHSALSQMLPTAWTPSSVISSVWMSNPGIRPSRPFTRLSRYASPASR